VVRPDGPVIHLVTRCSSVDEFVERFARFATETALVMPALSHVKVGTAGRFVIRLKDQSAVMSGRCRVDEVMPVAAAAGEAPRAERMVMRVRLLQMDERSRNVHRQLLACRRPGAPHPSGAAPHPSTAPPAPVAALPRSIGAPPPSAAAPPKLPPPLRIVRAPTLIGTGAPSVPVAATTPPGPSASSSAPLPTAPTLLFTPLVPPASSGAPPPQRASAAAPMPVAFEVSEPTVTTVSPQPAPETRVPSAALTLPANPLSDLDADDLATFVEFTLFEADDNEASSADHPESDDAQTTVGSVDLSAVRDEPGDRSGRAIDESADVGLRKARRIALRVAPYALCTLLGLLVGSRLRSAPTAPSRSATAPTPVAVPATAEAAPTAPPPTPAAATPTPTAPTPTSPPTVELTPAELAAVGSTPAAPTAAAPAAPTPAAPAARSTHAAARACVASVTTEPPGAVVLWGTLELGRSPVQSAHVPCGDATVVLRHERYQEVQTPVTARPGVAAVVLERLHRPMGTLVLSSSPPGASIKLNKQALGPAPRKLSTMRFERVHIEASLAGYQPWSKTIYVKDEVTKVNAPLVPASKADARPLIRR
jgi:PEGA domain